MHPNPALDQPSNWVERFARLIPPGRRVLDLACGRGRHARWLLEQGYPVVAVDIDTSGIQDLCDHPEAEIFQADLEAGAWPFPDRQFAGIVMVNYLHRPLFEILACSLEPGGVLIIDTFAAGNEHLGRPRNPAYLLQPGELRSCFERTLDIVAYEHGVQTEPRPAVRQRLCALKPLTAGDQ